MGRRLLVESLYVRLPVFLYEDKIKVQYDVSDRGDMNTNNYNDHTLHTFFMHAKKLPESLYIYARFMQGVYPWLRWLATLPLLKIQL